MRIPSTVWIQSIERSSFETGSNYMTLTINTRALLNPWNGPYGGVPPFDRVSIAALATALQTAMDEQLAELKVIANNPQPASFANTIEAFENSGRALDRVL